uniref:Uncharacterized protein n=1 Tax=Arundo donax TaxID=35708 RepID=A0A0A9F818_ARUDO
MFKPMFPCFRCSSFLLTPLTSHKEVKNYLQCNGIFFKSAASHLKTEYYFLNDKFTCASNILQLSLHLRPRPQMPNLTNEQLQRLSFI